MKRPANSRAGACQAQETALLTGSNSTSLLESLKPRSKDRPISRLILDLLLPYASSTQTTPSGMHLAASIQVVRSKQSHSNHCEQKWNSLVVRVIFFQKKRPVWVVRIFQHARAGPPYRPRRPCSGAALFFRPVLGQKHCNEFVRSFTSPRLNRGRANKQHGSQQSFRAMGVRPGLP